LNVKIKYYYVPHYTLFHYSYDGGELVSKIREKSYCSEEDVRIIITRLADAVGLFLLY